MKALTFSKDNPIAASILGVQVMFSKRKSGKVVMVSGKVFQSNAVKVTKLRELCAALGN